MTRNTTNTDPKPERVPKAKLTDAGRLVVFAYSIREAMPAEAHRHLVSAITHAPPVLDALSSFELPAYGVDVTAIVVWAKKELRLGVDTA